MSGLHMILLSHTVLLGLVYAAFAAALGCLVWVLTAGAGKLRQSLTREEPLTVVVSAPAPELREIAETWRHPASLAEVRAHACGPCNSHPGARTCICVGHCGRQGCRGARVADLTQARIAREAGR